MCHSISVPNIYADLLIDTGNIGETLIKKVLNQVGLKEKKLPKKIQNQRLKFGISFTPLKLNTFLVRN